jgi:hypothetical protein
MVKPDSGCQEPPSFGETIGVPEVDPMNVQQTDAQLRHLNPETFSFLFS